MDAGIWTSATQAVPADYSVPATDMLRDIVDEMNAEPGIAFEQQADDVSVTGSVLTFKPYTTAELAIIAGGGTVDITDRLVDFIPIQAPKVLDDDGLFSYLSLTDLLLGDDERSFAFRVVDDYSEIIFKRGPVSVSIVRNGPVTMDEEPTGVVHVPVMYQRYLITKLAESASIRYQMGDTAAIMAQRAQAQGQVVASQAVSTKPVKSNVGNALNRFRRWS